LIRFYQDAPFVQRRIYIDLTGVFKHQLYACQ